MFRIHSAVVLHGLFLLLYIFSLNTEALRLAMAPMDLQPLPPLQKDSAMFDTYNQLATEVVRRSFRPAEIGKWQHWIAVAGGPGSGKSTLTSALVDRINALSKSEDSELKKDVAVCLPMDGFHYSRKQLQEIADTHKDGVTYEALLARRGSPWTFDVGQLVSCLSEAKKNREGLLPTYSRQKSDPVWDPGVRLEKYHQIVFVEGNYLLNWDENLGAEVPGQREGAHLQEASRWKELQPLFDEKWFISCQSLEKQRERLISRHLETWTAEKTRMFGEGESGGAAKKADTNDVLNAHFVDLHRRWASREIVSL